MAYLGLSLRLKNHLLLTSSVLGGDIGDHILSAGGIKVANNDTESRETIPTKKSLRKQMHSLNK